MPRFKEGDIVRVKTGLKEKLYGHWAWIRQMNVFAGMELLIVKKFPTGYYLEELPCVFTDGMIEKTGGDMRIVQIKCDMCGHIVSEENSHQSEEFDLCNLCIKSYPRFPDCDDCPAERSSNCSVLCPGNTFDQK